MSLLERLTTLVRADAHGVVDALQDRRLILRQSLREAELELDRKRARIEALASEEQCLAVGAERLEGAIGTLDEDVELALAGDKEDLARFSLRKLIPLRSERERIERRRGEVTKEHARVLALLTEQEAELEALKLRVRSCLARESEDSGSEGSAAAPIVADEEIELELLRRRGAPQAPRRAAGAKKS